MSCSWDIILYKQCLENFILTNIRSSKMERNEMMLFHIVKQTQNKYENKQYNKRYNVKLTKNASSHSNSSINGNIYKLSL